MKRLYTLIILLISFALFTNGQTYFIEDFEAGILPEGWKIETKATDGGFNFGTATQLSHMYWTIPSNGGKIAGTNDAACDCDKSEDKLITKSFDLSNATIAYLSFDYILPLDDQSLKVYFSKDVTEEEFFFGLEKIRNGENYFSQGMQETLFNNYTKEVLINIPQSKDNLTEREVEVIKLFAEGLSFKDIAEQLFISIRTVETHKKNILTKLKLKSTVDLVKYAILNGIVSL